MRFLILATVLIAAVSVHAVAEDAPRKHPIDVKTEAEEEKAMSTADQTEVQANALKLWDAEMNRVYGELKKRLKPATFTALQAAQRDWLKYREGQRKFLGELYQEFEGTMYIPMHAAAVKEITRARTLELTRLLEIHQEFGG
jgi:uncharacterized protein YecT (DUF1311 family)